MVILKYMWTDPSEYQIWGGNLSHTFKKKNGISIWIKEQPCMQMGFKQFSRNNMYVSIPGKFSEIHLHAWLFSNPSEKVLIIVGISCSPDLRVQQYHFVYPKKKLQHYNNIHLVVTFLRHLFHQPKIQAFLTVRGVTASQPLIKNTRSDNQISIPAKTKEKSTILSSTTQILWQNLM